MSGTCSMPNSLFSEHLQKQPMWTQTLVFSLHRAAWATKQEALALSLLIKLTVFRGQESYLLFTDVHYSVSHNKCKMS